MDERPAHSLKAAALLGLVLVALIALAGCSSSSKDSSSSAAGGREQDAAAPARPGAPAAPNGTALGTPNRAIVYTGSLELDTADVPEAAAKAIHLVLASGGYVGSDQRENGKSPTVTLSLQVPSAKFTGTVDALAELGTETARRLNADDEQGSTIDLDAQISSQRASVNRIRALLGRADSLSELTQIESELTTRQTALATSEAQRRRLSDQVAYSTLTLHLAEPTTVAKPPVRKHAELGPVTGLEHGWAALLSSLAVVFTVVGWLAPFAALAAVLGIPAWLLWRRLRPRPLPSTE